MVRAHPAFKELSVGLKCGCWIPEAKLLAAGMLLAGARGRCLPCARCGEDAQPITVLCELFEI